MEKHPSGAGDSSGFHAVQVWIAVGVLCPHAKRLRLRRPLPSRMAERHGSPEP
jgi:hypothetical protein